MITTRLAAVDPAGRQTVHTQLAVAFDSGWTPSTLADWLAHQIRTAPRGVKNPAGFIVARLKGIPAPAEAAPAAARSAAPPVCGQCDARPDDPVSARVVWLDADKTRSERCPRCHPAAIAAA